MSSRLAAGELQVSAEPQVSGEPLMDSVFDMPAVNDPPSTEVGVILMGLDVRLLLAGLSVASLADDPAAVTLLVDQAQHTGAATMTMDDLVATGIDRWRAVREPLIAAGCGDEDTSAPRLGWSGAYRTLGRANIGEFGPATMIYLTACALRRVELDRYCAATTTKE